jgi:glycine/D-amino acid oxidase-like deaminating enzyme
MSLTAAVVICGAGISGIATAYHLAVTYGVKNVVIVDERPPLLNQRQIERGVPQLVADEMMVP